jgi:hypothetical protein
MNDTLISAITDFTLAARELLTREAGEQLEGIYGWLPDGSFGEAKRYPALAALPEAAETRRRLELYAREETEAGVTPPVAREKLKREAAFTWLNRSAAFRLLEERKLIKPTLARLHKSNGYVFWLTTDGNEANLALHEQGTLPLNLMGEGPADVAYRRWLLAQCEAQSAQVSVLFDPGTLATRLCPRPAALRQLVESMNTETLAPAWQAGNEETVGWLYQAFSSKELEAAFAAARESKKKFEPADIPAVTQLFTIRWVVRFLVENTLGRLWLEMHPDSRLKASLGYWVPVPSSQPRACKPVKEITFLDPCCGSMHFGLLAFDLFADMYREEREKAGQPGWPATPSAATEEEIPSLIAEHNLHGIDIDARAVQLSALTLLLRARTLNAHATVTDRNLACANVEQITGGQLEKFVKEAKFSNAIYERILRRLALRLKDSEHLGSLLRIETEIAQLIATERTQAKDLLGELPGLHPEQFDTPQGAEEFFGILSDQIVRHLDHFAQTARSAGETGGQFAAETAKGLRFLRLAEQRYDVVATNPPYLSGRKMNKRLAGLLESEFPEGKGDLYAAFISRCQELLKPEGLVGMLTMHSFMFISSYEDLRKKLRKEIAVETLAHFGGGLFAVGNPGTLQTAAFVLRKESHAKKREAQVGTYFRLVKERDAEAKRTTFEAAVAACRQGEAHAQVFAYKQGDFDAIPGMPFVYWITARIRRVFSESACFKDLADWKRGLSTGENPRFIRYHWEVSRDEIGTQTKWCLCMKGGQRRKWFGNQFFAILFENDGAEMKSLKTKAGKPAAYLRNTTYYRREGLCYNSITSSGFSARFMPAGFIFDQASNTIFSNWRSIYEVAAIINSTLAQWVLSLNPTINVVKDDLDRIPFPKSANPVLEQLGKRATELGRAQAGTKEVEWCFTAPLLQDDASRLKEIAEIEKLIDAALAEALSLSEDEYAAFSEKVIDTVEDEAESEEGSDEEGSEEVFADETAPSDTTRAVHARSWVSYAIGTVLGRFAIGEAGGLGCGDFKPEQVTAIRALIDADGVMPCEKGHPQDLAARAAACLALMLGEATARDTIRTATGETGDPADALRTWLDRFTGTPEKSFWKYHHQLYRKRPIYWPLQSPDKNFTVWIFQERFTKETLFTVKKLADEQLNLLNRRAADLRPESTSNRAKAKALDAILEQVDDLAEFITRIEVITQRGYTPCIDDGVLLNAAPLHPLLPSWPETKKAWQELEGEKYEWAHQAMLHWPDRVKAACKTNKSFAIAHGLA